LWNQIDALQNHFKRNPVPMRLWTRVHGMLEWYWTGLYVPVFSLNAQNNVWEMLHSILTINSVQGVILCLDSNTKSYRSFYYFLQIPNCYWNITYRILFVVLWFSKKKTNVFIVYCEGLIFLGNTKFIVLFVNLLIPLDFRVKVQTTIQLFVSYIVHSNN